jgi:hypothetical protein
LGLATTWVAGKAVLAIEKTPALGRLEG